LVHSDSRSQTPRREIILLRGNANNFTCRSCKREYQCPSNKTGKSSNDKTLITVIGCSKPSNKLEINKRPSFAPKTAALNPPDLCVRWVCVVIVNWASYKMVALTTRRSKTARYGLDFATYCSFMGYVVLIILQGRKIFY